MLIFFRIDVHFSNFYHQINNEQKLNHANKSRIVYFIGRVTLTVTKPAECVLCNEHKRARADSNQMSMHNAICYAVAAYIVAVPVHKRFLSIQLVSSSALLQFVDVFFGAAEGSFLFRLRYFDVFLMQSQILFLYIYRYCVQNFEVKLYY